MSAPPTPGTPSAALYDNGSDSRGASGSRTGAVVVHMELEHAIGCCAVPHSVHVLPGTTRYFFVAGGCIVAGNYEDPHDQTFVRGHDDDITCLRLSDSGRFLVSGQRGHNADVVLWDAESYRPIHRFREHDKGVTAVAIASDDSIVATVGVDRRLAFFDASNGGIITHMPLALIVPPGDDIIDVVFGPRVQDVKRRDLGAYHVSVVTTSMLLMFHLDPFKACVQPLRVNLGPFQRKYTGARYSAGGDLLLLGSTAGDIAVVSTESLTVVHTARVCTNGVAEIVLVASADAPRQLGAGPDFRYARFGPGSGRSSTFFVGGGDGAVVGCVISDHTNPTVQTISKNAVEAPVSSLSVIGVNSLGSHSLLVATSKGTVSLVQCAGKSQQQSPYGGGGTIQAPPQQRQAGFGNGGNRLGAPSQNNGASSHASFDEAVRRISDAVASPFDVVAPHPSASDRVVTASHDGLLRLWDLNEYRILGTFETASKNEAARVRCSSLCVSDGLEIMLSAWSDGCVRCYDLTSFALLWTHTQAHRSPITAMCLSLSMKYFVTGASEGDVKVWDIRTRELKGSLEDHRQAVVSLQLFEDDKHLLSGSRDRTVIAWDLTTMRRVTFLETHSGPLTSMLLCSNQCNVYTAALDHTIALWDLRHKDPVRSVPYAPAGSDAHCTTLTRSRDERLLATGGTDQVVQLWDERLLQRVCTGYGHSASVVGCAFTADNRQVLSCGLDSCVMVWNVYQ